MLPSELAAFAACSSNFAAASKRAGSGSSSRMASGNSAVGITFSETAIHSSPRAASHGFPDPRDAARGLRGQFSRVQQPLSRLEQRQRDERTQPAVAQPELAGLAELLRRGLVLTLAVSLQTGHVHGPPQGLV